MGVCGLASGTYCFKITHVVHLYSAAGRGGGDAVWLAVGRLCRDGAVVLCQYNRRTTHLHVFVLSISYCDVGLLGADWQKMLITGFLRAVYRLTGRVSGLSAVVGPGSVPDGLADTPAAPEMAWMVSTSFCLCPS